MDQKAIFALCKKLGCCDACGLRYLGIRNPKAYENSKEFALKFQDPPAEQLSNGTAEGSSNEPVAAEKPSTNGDSPPPKKHKANPCVSCLGVLQEDVWAECNDKVKEMLDKKRYECANFACALSAPIATILREKAISLRLQDAFSDYDPTVLTPLKEPWKWSFALQLATHVGKALDSGAVSPLLVTLHMDYQDDAQELEVLKILSPDLFESRGRQKRRFAVEFTRRAAEQAVAGAALSAVAALDGWRDGPPTVAAGVNCVSVSCTHAPMYLGGRYVKRSRALPQTPWVVCGRRVVDSSVQEIIFQPLAAAYQLSAAEAEHRLKFLAAGREDVDVRCLGDGRPFAIEVTDPRRELTAEELSKICEEISSSGQVVVKKMVPVTREDLADLKKGEENKCKTYEALCIKLTHSDYDTAATPDSPVTVTPEDIRRLNAYRNTAASHAARVSLTQRTPVRVLHRRPLLARERLLYDVYAEALPEHPQLLVVRMRTSAGAYVKEAVHGELGRTRPALGVGVGARLDLLALDVAAVHLDWPNNKHDG